MLLNVLQFILDAQGTHELAKSMFRMAVFVKSDCENFIIHKKRFQPFFACLKTLMMEQSHIFIRAFLDFC